MAKSLRKETIRPGRTVQGDHLPFLLSLDGNLGLDLGDNLLESRDQLLGVRASEGKVSGASARVSVGRLGRRRDDDLQHLAEANVVSCIESASGPCWLGGLPRDELTVQAMCSPPPLPPS